MTWGLSAAASLGGQLEEVLWDSSHAGQAGSVCPIENSASVRSVPSFLEWFNRVDALKTANKQALQSGSSVARSSSRCSEQA